jgi:hypothetical protein
VLNDDNGSRWCDVRKEHMRRAEPAVRTITCKVEGRQVDLCGNHSSLWIAKVQARPVLASYCPNCVHLVKIQDDKVPGADTRPLTGPLADALDNAMMRSGVLIDKRQMTLRFLAENQDPYVGSILRSTAGDDAFVS